MAEQDWVDVADNGDWEDVSPNAGFAKPSFEDTAFDTIARLGKGAYAATSFLPFMKNPVADEVYGNIPKGNVPQQVVEAIGSAAPTIAMANPFVKGASALPFIGRSAIATGAAGFGGFEAAKKAIEGKPNEALPAAAQGAASGALFGLGGRVGSQIMPKFIPAAERVGTALGAGAAGAAMAPEDEKVSSFLVGAGLGAMNPVSRIEVNEAKVNQKILNDINKSLRPTVIGKNKYGYQQENFKNNVLSGVKDIVFNKDNIELNGEKGRLPQDLGEFKDAIQQQKKAIWNERVAAAQQSEGTIKLGDAYRKALSPLLTSDVVKINNPGVIKQYQAMIRRADEAGEVPISRAHDLLTDLNKGLEPFYKNPTLVPDSMKLAEASLAKELRTKIDDAVESGLGGGYSELGKRYGSLRSLEKELLPRIIVSGRAAPKGFFDLADLWAVPKTVKGIMTGNGAEVLEGIGTLGVKNYIKSKNDPNNIIRDMFSFVDKHSGKLTRPKGIIKNPTKEVEPLRITFQPPLPKYLQERQNIPPLRTGEGVTEYQNPIHMQGEVIGKPLEIGYYPSPQQLPVYLQERTNIPSMNIPKGKAESSNPIPMKGKIEPSEAEIRRRSEFRGVPPKTERPSFSTAKSQSQSFAKGGVVPDIPPARPSLKVIPPSATPEGNWMNNPSLVKAWEDKAASKGWTKKQIENTKKEFIKSRGNAGNFGGFGFKKKFSK